MSGFSGPHGRIPLKQRGFAAELADPNLSALARGMSAQQALALPSAGGVEYRGDQCALQLADRSGSARDRRRRTAGASLSRRGCGRRGLCDGVPGGVGLRPANGRGAGVWPIGAHRAAPPSALCAGRDGGARSRGRLASRSATDLRATSAQHRAAEKPGDEQPGGRAPAGGEREGNSQAGRTFDARRERTACVRRDDDRSGGGAAGGWRAVCKVDRR